MINVAIYLLAGVAAGRVFGFRGLLEILTWPLVLVLMLVVWVLGGDLFDT